MTTEDISQMINKRGAVAKTIFYGWYQNLIGEWDDSPKERNYIRDTIATLVYNGTILAMKKILENPDFFEKRCGVCERNRIRMRKDLEDMTHIDYPNDVPNLDFDYCEMMLENCFLITDKDDECNKLLQ